MKYNMLKLVGVLALAGSPLVGSAWAQSAPSTSADMAFVTHQPANEWLARVFLGAAVQNTSGETVGEINDLVFEPSGRISTVVLGVGGFLGMGEKNVAVPYSALSFKAGKDDVRIIVVALSKDALDKAPAFMATEKTTMDKVKEKAADLGHKAAGKAVELKDQAAKKIDEMKKSDPAKP